MYSRHFVMNKNMTKNNFALQVLTKYVMTMSLWSVKHDYVGSASAC